MPRTYVPVTPDGETKIVVCPKCMKSFNEKGLSRHLFYCDPDLSLYREHKPRSYKHDDRKKISIPPELLEIIRHMAAYRNTSMQAIVTERLMGLIDEYERLFPDRASKLKEMAVTAPIPNVVNPQQYIGKTYPFTAGETQDCPICGGPAPDVGGIWKCMRCRVGGRVNLVSDILQITRAITQ